MPERRLLNRRPRAAGEYDEPPAPRRLHRSDRPAETDTDDDDDDLISKAVGKGWGGWKRTKANAPSKWSKLYKVTDEEQIIMFLEDAPYASFLLHWCDWVARGQKQSYICLQPCPLDDIQKPTARVRFNIVDLQGDTPILSTFECGYTITDVLDKHVEQDHNPLEGSYWAIQMVGKKNSRRTQIRPVKIRDLQEDWGIDALTREEIDKFSAKLWTADSLEVSSRKELQEVADAAAE